MTNSDPLDDVRIWRAGASASTYNAAGTSVLIRASHTLDLQFSIPAAGGGRTSIMVSIGPGGIPALMEKGAVVLREKDSLNDFTIKSLKKQLEQKETAGE